MKRFVAVVKHIMQTNTDLSKDAIGNTGLRRKCSHCSISAQMEALLNSFHFLRHCRTEQPIYRV